MRLILLKDLFLRDCDITLREGFLVSWSRFVEVPLILNLSRVAPVSDLQFKYSEPLQIPSENLQHSSRGPEKE